MALARAKLTMTNTFIRQLFMYKLYCCIFVTWRYRSMEIHDMIRNEKYASKTVGNAMICSIRQLLHASTEKTITWAGKANIPRPRSEMLSIKISLFDIVFNWPVSCKVYIKRMFENNVTRDKIAHKIAYITWNALGKSWDISVMQTSIFTLCFFFQTGKFRCAIACKDAYKIYVIRQNLSSEPNTATNIKSFKNVSVLLMFFQQQTTFPLTLRFVKTRYYVSLYDYQRNLFVASKMFQ